MGRTQLFISKEQTKGIPKLRHKEEKKKLIKLCLRKLKTIDDTEELLCKAVLITNTIRSIRQFNNNMETDFIAIINNDCDERDEAENVDYCESTSACDITRTNETKPES